MLPTNSSGWLSKAIFQRTWNFSRASLQLKVPYAKICQLIRHSRQKVQARSAVPFAVELFPGFQVDGTWNVPTTLTLGGCVLFVA